MKKVLFFCVVFIFFTAGALAADVTVRGDTVRGPVVSALINSYFPGVKGVAVVDNSLGENVLVTGAGGSERIHFSGPLVAKLQKLTANPRAGEGLMSICPGQAKQLARAVGPMPVAVAKAPIITWEEKSSHCDRSGGCYGKVLTGKYRTLKPFQGVRLVSNVGNQNYPNNSISFKIEYHEAGLTGWPYGTGWGPTIVVRNATVENPFELLNMAAPCILPYLERIKALKKGQPGTEGDSCWEVVLLRDGSLYKDESPAEAPFGR